MFGATINDQITRWKSYLTEWFRAIDAFVNAVTFALSLLDIILEDSNIINSLK